MYFWEDYWEGVKFIPRGTGCAKDFLKKDLLFVVMSVWV